MEALARSVLKAPVQCIGSAVVESSSQPRPSTSLPSVRAPERRFSSSAAVSNVAGCFRVRNALRGKEGQSSGRGVVEAKAVTVAQGYAQALLELSQGAGVLDAVHGDMEKLENLFKNKELTDFLFNPTVDEGRKKSILSTLGSDAGLHVFTQNFLNLLVDKKRITAIEAVITAFDEQYCSLTQTQVAVVTSAVKLENAQQALIAKKLQTMTGAKNIKLKNVVEPSLIAGFVLKYGKDGSCEIDMSVKGQLDKLAAEFAASANAGAVA